MNWNYVKLGDVCTKIGSGATPKGGSKVYIELGTSLIRSQNVYNLSFDYNGLVHIASHAARKLNGVIVYEKDVLLNITGDSVARTCIVPTDVLPARVSQHVAIIRPDSKVLNPYFLNYYLASPYMQSYMLGLATGRGTSRNAMTKMMIEDFIVPVPPVSIQNRIVEILSTYDNLIENNRKQIKLLEEAAQRLYREWFVDFRFPGWESVPVVDGLPTGWRIDRLDSIGVFCRGKNITKTETKPGFVPVVAGGLEPAYYHNLAFTKAPVITVSGSGANAGFTRLYHQEIWASDCSFLDVSSTDYLYFIYCFLKQSKDVLDKMQKGAAQPHVYAKDINALSVIIPPFDLLREFDHQARTFFSLLANSSKKIEKARQARGSLLEKLLNNELEV